MYDFFFDAQNFFYFFSKILFFRRFLRLKKECGRVG
jgi:hypothetical protein